MNRCIFRPRIFRLYLVMVSHVCVLIIALLLLASCTENLQLFASEGTLHTLEQQARIYQDIFPSDTFQISLIEKNEDNVESIFQNFTESIDYLVEETFTNFIASGDLLTSFINLNDYPDIRDSYLSENFMPIFYTMLIDSVLIIANVDTEITIDNFTSDQIIFLLSDAILGRSWGYFDEALEDIPILVYSLSPSTDFMISLTKKLKEIHGSSNTHLGYVGHKFNAFVQENTMEEVIEKVINDTQAIGIISLSALKHINYANIFSKSHRLKVFTIENHFPSYEIQGNNEIIIYEPSARSFYPNEKYLLNLPIFLYVNGKQLYKKQVLDFIEVSLQETHKQIMKNYVGNTQENVHAGKEVINKHLEMYATNRLKKPSRIE